MAGDQNEVVELIAQSKSQRGSLVETLLNTGRELHYKRNFTEAAEHYRAALALHPHQPDLLYELGRAYNNQGKLRQARNVFRCVLAQQPGYVRAHYALGHVYQRIGEERFAAEAFKNALRLQPDFIDALNAIGTLCLAAADDAAAEKYLIRSLELRPAQITALCNLGVCQLNQRKFAEALETLEECISLDPELGPAWANLGVTRFELGLIEESIDAFLIAFKQQSPNSSLISFYCAAMAKRGDRRGVIKVASDGLALPSDQLGEVPTEDYKRIGDAVRYVGDLKLAIRCYGLALSHDPSSRQAYLQYSAALTELGLFADALEYIDRCLLLFPRYQSAIALRISILQHLDRRAEARSWQDFDTLLRVEDMPSVDGYPSMKDFNAKLETRVRSESSLEYERKGNATRNGRHTGLLDLDIEPYRSLAVRIKRACCEYMDSFAEHRGGHPFLSGQPTKWRLQMWAVVMDTHGHQLPHTHDDGHISGVYYVSLPQSIEKGKNHDGWLEFGRPAAGLPEPGLSEMIQVEPRPGRLVLFPSYFVHGTIPFSDKQSRISIAFDLRPTKWASTEGRPYSRRSICHLDRIAFLDTYSATNARHSGRRLKEHLIGVYELLRDWRERNALCNAGLFHSIYGTESFRGKLPPRDLRGVVKTLIGEEAERIAWLFGILRKRSLYENVEVQSTEYCIRSRFDDARTDLSEQDLIDLNRLTIANWMEQAPRSSVDSRKKAHQLLVRLRPFLGEEALAQFDAQNPNGPCEETEWQPL